MSENWSCLTKKELLHLLEPYDDKTNIVFGVNLQQGYVGFFDLEEDTTSNREEFILNSKTLDEWYKKDMKEVK